MSFIQNIRDKYARIAVIFIGLALLGFIMMDAFSGRTGMFNNNQSTTVGKVNGEPIDRIEFDKMVRDREQAAIAQGYPVSDEYRQSLMQNIWNQKVEEVVMKDEYEKLGLTVTEKELNDILYGANPPQDLRQRFSDENGVFNAAAARQEVARAMKDPIQKQGIQEYFESLKSQKLMSKYMSLLTNTIHFPKWFLEKRNIDNSLIGKISFVNIPYSTIADSTVKVSDDEIRDYMEKYREDFEQKEETRSISYVSFSAAPNARDSAEARNSLMELKAAFDSTSDPKRFTEANGSDYPYSDMFTAKSALPLSNADSALSAPVGTVYGPFVDMNRNTGKGIYVLSKIYAVKQLPDTVKVRHILVATNQRTQNGMVPVRTDSAAKKLADSLQGLINAGQSFDTLVVKFSEDPGSKDKGGVYENIVPGQMVPTFNDFIFENSTGKTGIVKTDFGYHLIEILSQKGSSPAYKVAFLTREIVASSETDQEAHNRANLFAGDSRNLNSFNSNYEKNLKSKGIPKLVANDITALDYSVNGITGNGRSFIKKVFEEDKGDVIGPERVGENYIVAIITEVNEPGLVSLTTARVGIEPILRNRKKADQIIKNIGTVTTLEQVATKTGQSIQMMDSLRFGSGSQMGYEPKVVGASFNPANKGKVVPEPIAGSSGVYALRVESTGTTPVESANIDEQRRMMEMQAQQSMASQMQQGYNPIVEVLKRKAKIKDNRAEFY